MSAIASTVAVLGALFLPEGSAAASVSQVNGSAFGYHAYDLLFNGQCPSANACAPGHGQEAGPAPAVALASDASNSPQGIAQPAGTVNTVTAGPARLFTSGPITVYTEGSTGAAGAVHSRVDISNITNNNGESFWATALHNDCSAGGPPTHAITIEDGRFQTDSGLDANGDGDYVDSGEHPPADVAVPRSPAPNTEMTGHLHVPGGQDNYRYVFNEVVDNGNGSFTYNAVHAFFLGPFLTGEMILGRAVCGTTGTGTRPVADFDADGHTDIGVFRPSTGVWFVNGGATTAWGTNGDIPVPGDYNGDGHTDMAVFRPSNGVWFVSGGATTAWGTNGDRPLPSPAAIGRFFFS